jgi:tol-pal system protein YbgF
MVELKPVHSKVKKERAPVVDTPISPPETGNAKPVPTPKTVVAEAEPTPKTAPATDTNSSLFNKAREAFRRAKYQDAYALFEQYLNTDPPGPRIAETHYLMGECLFKQKEYDLAILDYQKVITNYTKSKYAPSALLKQAMCFEKLQDRETAKIVYETLIKDYPDSPQVATAQQRMQNL